jgi:branched-chain amino acid transport system permease protein
MPNSLRALLDRLTPAPVRFGLLGGAIGVMLALVGMIGRFAERPIVEGVISLGQTLLLAVLFLTGYYAAERARNRERPRSHWLLYGLVAGLIAAALLALLVVVGARVNLRTMFINAAPELYIVLTFSQGGRFSPEAGLLVLLGVGAGLGLLAALAHFLPPIVRESFSRALVVVVLLGLLGELLTLSNIREVALLRGWLLASKGLALPGTVILLVVITALNLLLHYRGGVAGRALAGVPPQHRRTLRTAGLIVAVAILFLLPQILGSYHSQVLNQTGLFVLLGLGLNIVVGFAGMLDLGYVAFYALGAYTVGVLTSPERLGITDFWVALPLAILVAVVAGVILGVPVLRMRGDYLAIVTLGFGEIIRLLALSDWLRPLIGGAQGIAGIPPITLPAIAIGGLELFGGYSASGPDKPQKLYFFIVAAAFLAAFIAMRLKDSRQGRAWMAIREDEDVAQAMGINLVWTKLMAFAVGAGLSGMSGALLGAQLSSIYPHSFAFLVSINILALIIVGGMGSIPGVVVGAIALVGLPELLREFAEFRNLVFGAVLVIMMLQRPEGLVPDVAHQRELHYEEPAELEQDQAPEEPVPMITTEVAGDAPARD